MSPDLHNVDNLSKMRQGITYRFPVSIRGLSLKLRPLSIMEETEIESEVYEHLMNLPEGKRTRLYETRLLATKSIQLASTSDVGEKDVQISEYELNRFSADELQYLWKQYLLGVNKVNPSLETIDPKEMEQLAADLKKNPSTLIELSSSHILNLVKHLLTQSEQQQVN